MSRALLAVLAALVVGGCASPRVSDLPAREQAWLASLKSGESRQEDVLKRLGEPSERFGDGRTMVYYIRIIKARGIRVEPPSSKCPCWGHQLVLVFEVDGTLRQYSIIDSFQIRGRD